MTDPRRFTFALSFAGEYRAQVQEVAALLAKDVDRSQVLYDQYHDAELARPDLDVYLQQLYRERSELIVLFLCPEYQQKQWCRLEWRSIRQLIASTDAARIMFLSFGDPGDLTEIGIYSGDGYVDISDLSPQQVHRKIQDRLARNRRDGDERGGAADDSPDTKGATPPHDALLGRIAGFPFLAQVDWDVPHAPQVAIPVAEDLLLTSVPAIPKEVVVGDVGALHWFVTEDAQRHEFTVEWVPDDSSQLLLLRADCADLVERFPIFGPHPRPGAPWGLLTADDGDRTIVTGTFEGNTSRIRGHDRLAKALAGGPIMSGSHWVGVAHGEQSGRTLSWTKLGDHLCEDGWKAHLGIADSTAQRTIQSGVRAVLSGALDPLKEQLATTLNVHSDDEVINALLTGSQPEVTRQLAEVSMRLIERRQPEALDDLRRLVNYVLPALADQAVAFSMRLNQGATDQPLVDADVNTATTAEVLMAAFDGRPMELHSLDDGSQPEGAFALPGVPTVGIDSDGSKFADAFAQHFVNKYPPPSEESLVTLFGDELIKQAEKAAPRRVNVESERLDYAKAVLANLAAGGRTYYLLVPIAEDSKARMLSIVKTLKEKFPMIVFLALPMDVAREAEDSILITNLKTIHVAQS